MFRLFWILPLFLVRSLIGKRLNPLIRTGAFISSLVFIQILPLSAESIQIHKYQDDAGVWHYSDTRPKTDQTVQSREALTSKPRPKIRLQRETKDKTDTVVAFSDYHGPAEVEIRFHKIENVRIADITRHAFGDGKKVRRYIVTQKGKLALFTVRPANAFRRWQYRFSYRYLPGDPRATHDQHFKYRPPFATDGRFIISQAFNGSYSHQNGHNRYAIDIAMPVGTPVHCARSGRVMEVMNDYFWAGANLAYYGPRSNLIRIVHDDGTMGLYVHLQRGSAVVTPGQYVKVGEMIARSGNTGYSTGPHLHFSILINEGMNVVSVPFRFKGSGGVDVIPARGLTLTNGG